MRDFWQGRRVFLTGHTGFKGSWMTLLLHKLGAEVLGYSDRVPTQPSHFELSDVSRALVSDRRGDIRDGKALSAAMAEFSPNIVFHMAAQPLVRESLSEPVETYSVNVMGTVHCLEAIRSVPGISAAVIVTSDKVYADQNSSSGYRETDQLGGADPYSASKACAELVVSNYRQSFMLDGRQGGTVIASARAGNVIGGGDFSADRLVPDLIRAIETNKPLTLRYPMATRPWQHVLDPLLGYLRLAQALAEGHTRDNAWNFGPPSTRQITVQQFVDGLSNAMDLDLPVNTTESIQAKETHLLQVDSTKASVGLGWQPSISFERMLDLTAGWYGAYRSGKKLPEISRKQLDEVLETAIV